MHVNYLPGSGSSVPRIYCSSRFMDNSFNTNLFMHCISIQRGLSVVWLCEVSINVLLQLLVEIVTVLFVCSLSHDCISAIKLRTSESSTFFIYCTI